MSSGLPARERLFYVDCAACITHFRVPVVVNNLPFSMRVLISTIDKADLLWAGVTDQLGALSLERNGEIDGPLLDRAMDCFQESRDRWRAERNHREGFSLRREALGQR